MNALSALEREKLRRLLQDRPQLLLQRALVCGCAGLERADNRLLEAANQKQSIIVNTPPPPYYPWWNPRYYGW